jgi:DNA-binding response OmpR family regulator
MLHTRHGLRTIHSASEAFHLLRDGCEDVDLAIIDLDPGMHGAALLEAAGDRLPVLVLTSLEENYMHPVATRHGARGCLAKPCTAEKLVAAIEAVLQMSHAAVA